MWFEREVQSKTLDLIFSCAVFNETSTQRTVVTWNDFGRFLSQSQCLWHNVQHHGKEFFCSFSSAPFCLWKWTAVVWMLIMTCQWHDVVYDSIANATRMTGSRKTEDLGFSSCVWVNPWLSHQLWPQLAILFSAKWTIWHVREATRHGMF